MEKDFMKDNFVSLKFIDSNGSMRDKVIKKENKWKDTNFDGSSFGFSNIEFSDLTLHPDNSSEHYDPIRKMQSVICYIRNPDGSELEADFRTQAYKAMMQDKRTQGAFFGVEPELFICQRNTNNELFPFGIETKRELGNIKQGDHYGSLPPIDETQEIRNDIAHNLILAGLEIESIHAEVAKSQAEITWKYDNLLRTADKMLLFKYIVSATCKNWGLEANFTAKPFSNLNANGCHVHISIPSMKTNPEHIEQFAQGLVDNFSELLKVCCVGETSMARLNPDFEAPSANEADAKWGYGNRSVMVRIPGSKKTSSRIECRLGDSELNPYIVLPLMLKYGINGLK